MIAALNLAQVYVGSWEVESRVHLQRIFGEVVLGEGIVFARVVRNSLQFLAADVWAPFGLAEGPW